MCWFKWLKSEAKFMMVVLLSCTFLLTLGSKHSMSGIQKPRSNFLPSGIQKAPQALRPPATKCVVASSARADDPQVPAGAKATF